MKLSTNSARTESNSSREESVDNSPLPGAALDLNGTSQRYFVAAR